MTGQNLVYPLFPDEIKDLVSTLFRGKPLSRNHTGNNHQFSLRDKASYVFHL